MSQAWAEYGIGLILTGEDIEELVENMGYRDEYELVDEAENDAPDLCVRYYSQDEMSGLTYRPFEADTEMYPDSMLVIWAKKQPHPCNAVYTHSELVEEFEEGPYGKYLPEDFDVEEHLGYFSCCITC